MFKKLTILFFCWFVGNTVYAQPPLDWTAVANNGGTFQDLVEDVFVDAAGNTYVCGSFRGALTIGSNNLYANAAGQAFVAKYNNLGVVQWAIQSDGSNQAVAKSIFVDAAGATYVAGYHSHTTLDFGVNISSSSNESFYLLKINASGAPIHITGPTFASTGKSQAWGVTGNGTHVFVTGLHKGPLNLPGGQSLPLTQGGSDVFIAKVDSAFTAFTWAFSHGGPLDETATGLAIDGNNLYATGNYQASDMTFFTTGTDYILPNYGNQSFWITRFSAVNGSVNWASSGGSDTGPVRSNDVTVQSGQLFVVGAASDITKLVQSPATSGPFTYNDTIYSNGQMDAFVVRYNGGGSIQAKWSNGGTGDDEAFGVAMDISCGTIQVCGSFENTVDFGSEILTALDKDIYVTATSNSGIPIWTFKQSTVSNGIPRAISTNGGISSIGGEIYGNSYFTTLPLTFINWKGSNDFFVFSYDCSSSYPCGPSIDVCQQNDTVAADAACSYVLGDYTGLSITDGCGLGGVSVAQDPPNLSILSGGIHLVSLTAEDLAGTKDVCFFNVVVKAKPEARIATCGDEFFGETTGGNGNIYSSFSCSSINTPGQDALYQVTVNESNQFLQVKLDNVVDANDEYMYLYFLSSDCPTLGNCLEVDSFNISAAQFSNNSHYLTFTAPGPGTYYLVLDAMVDSIESYDISFYCASSGIEFDNTSCNVLDTDLDGIVPYLNGSNADLTMQPCESVQICHDLYIKNENDWEWVDSIEFKLGNCYENINVSTLTPNPGAGNYDGSGQWTAVYNGTENSILWEFAHGSGNPWGDGDDGMYNCFAYNFCFDADIASTCINSEGLNIGIVIGDDGGKGIAPPSNIFEIGNSNEFILQDDNPFFSYPEIVLCNGDPSTLPDSVTTTGGMFTATAGIIFTDGSPSPTGEIDLMASTIGGPYTITYTVGLCPFTHDFILDINDQEDPAFNFNAAAYCQGDTDPVPTVTGTTGGTFTGPAEITFVSSSTGEIDLSASTAGGPYYITYTTPGPYCINADSVQVTINAEDDPSFAYSANDYCAADANQLPTSITTAGGSFSEQTGNLTVNASTGEVTISTSALANYYVVYTTTGICPNTDSVVFNVNAEDDPSYSYPANTYCQGDANPVPTVTGTTGGTYSGPAGIVFVSTTTGEVDLSSSTAGGPYTITYTTPGPICPNSSTFDITINPEDDASFNFSSNVFCAADVNQIPTITGTTGGTFSGPTEISFISTSTGEIDVAASTIGGPYTITYTTPGPNCPNSSDVIINIYPEDDPTFSYSSTSYCSEDNNPLPFITMAGGNFTAPAGIVFVSGMTGEIDLSNSTAGGPYEIIYFSPGPECINTDTAFVTINANDQASIDYGSAYLCTTSIIGAAVIIGTTGGSFSGDAGLIIDGNSGSIDLANSSTGIAHTIQYITTGICPDTAITNVQIFEPPVADAGPDQELTLTDQTQLHAGTPVNGTGIWTLISGSGDLSDDTDTISSITNLQNGVNELLWTVSNLGCPGDADTVIINLRDLFIPEALTPNGDGLNDYFRIIGLELIDNEVTVFNRWGQKVLEVVNYQNDWDGKDMNGKELSADTYFYVIKAKEDTYKGFIVLTR
ncbi:MAG: gliding motility-associated C-terminal domain-containing protein [Crocinitomicaceae bacterium]|nr:gliding motility-associated C-terminal domain-containing protein [Crocinitomicaceae bacterium]